MKDVQTRLASLERMRNGFPSSRAHMTTQRPVFLDRRMLELERDMERGKRRSQAADPADPS